MNAPTLSLCIPAYQAAWCLPRLLKSAQAQQISFDEVLVFDDCSPDETAQVARDYGAAVISGRTNIGCSAGKNLLLEETKSDWVHFHDADDLLLPHFTKLAHRWMERGVDCPDVVLFDFEQRDNETEELLGKSDFSPEQLQKDALRYAILNQINPFCGLYRRNRLREVGGYDTEPEILYNEDVAFHCKLAAAGLSFSAEKEVSIVNFRIGDSMSGANRVKCLHAQHAVMRRLANQVGRDYGEEIAYKLWGIATGLATVDEWGEVDQALDLVKKLISRLPERKREERAFLWLCRIAGWKRAFRWRENLILRFKPHLRSSQ